MKHGLGAEAMVGGWVAEGLVQWLDHVDDMAGLPKALIEAGACGLPLVTTDVPGCHKVVANGVDSLLAPHLTAHLTAWTKPVATGALRVHPAVFFLT